MEKPQIPGGEGKPGGGMHSVQLFPFRKWVWDLGAGDEQNITKCSLNNLFMLCVQHKLGETRLERKCLCSNKIVFKSNRRQHPASVGRPYCVAIQI